MAAWTYGALNPSCFVFTCVLLRHDAPRETLRCDLSLPPQPCKNVRKEEKLVSHFAGKTIFTLCLNKEFILFPGWQWMRRKQRVEDVFANAHKAWFVQIMFFKQNSAITYFWSDYFHPEIHLHDKKKLWTFQEFWGILWAFFFPSPFFVEPEVPPSHKCLCHHLRHRSQAGWQCRRRSLLCTHLYPLLHWWKKWKIRKHISNPDTDDYNCPACLE